MHLKSASTVPTNKSPVPTDKLIDMLTFANYKHNRESSPNVPAKNWGKIYPNAVDLEEKFQETKIKF